VRLPRRGDWQRSLKGNIGNEAPEVSVEVLLAADGEADPLFDDKRVWSLIQ